MDHVYKNNIVTPEQAAGKKRVWETVEQLLINKSILKEVRLMRHNLVTVWLHYRKTISIKRATKVPHNKPDLVIWDKANKLCSIVEFSCPADINITQKVNDKINVYGLLIRNLQIMYPQYRFNMVPIIVGALSYIPKCLTSYLHDLRFDKNEWTVHIMKMQNIVACNTVKIYKTFLRFK